MGRIRINCSSVYSIVVFRFSEVCNASVVFGLGKELYQTEEVKSSEPEWNQEASM